MSDRQFELSEGHNMKHLPIADVRLQGARVWLEMIPTDFASRIAESLTRDRTVRHFISFAETRPPLCKIAKAVVGAGFVPKRKALAQRWDKLLGAELIDFCALPHPSLFPEVVPFLKSLEWNSATFDIEEICTVTLHQTGTLKPLTLLLNLDFALPTFNEVICGGICELSIRCRCPREAELHECFVQQVRDYLGNNGFDAEPKVKKLFLNCNSWSGRLCYSMLSMFKCLREVTLHGLAELSDDMAKELQKMDAVHLRDISMENRHDILKNGQVVTTLAFEPKRNEFQDHMTTLDLSGLASCSRLESLEIEVRGVPKESLIAALVALPPTLRELHLEWFDWAYSPPHSASKYCRAISRELVSFVQNSPYLSVFRLRGFVLKNEIAQILKSTGTKLVELDLEVLPHDLIEMLEPIMEQMAQANFNVRRIWLQEALSMEFYDNEDTETEVLEHLLEKGLQLQSTLNVLRRRAPMLDASCLEGFVCTEQENVEFSDLAAEKFSDLLASLKAGQ